VPAKGKDGPCSRKKGRGTSTKTPKRTSSPEREALKKGLKIRKEKQTTPRERSKGEVVASVGKRRRGV